MPLYSAPMLEPYDNTQPASHWLAAAQHELGLNQTEFAMALHRHRNTVALWLSGKKVLPYIVIAGVERLLEKQGLLAKP